MRLVQVVHLCAFVAGVHLAIEVAGRGGGGGVGVGALVLVLVVATDAPPRRDVETEHEHEEDGEDDDPNEQDDAPDLTREEAAVVLRAALNCGRDGTCRVSNILRACVCVMCVCVWGGCTRV